MTQFNPGDVVELKSGGPIMTVDSYKKIHKDRKYDENQLVCRWFNKDQELETATFYASSLKMAESDAL